MKRWIAFLLTVCLLLSVASLSVFASDKGNTVYTIVNPYEKVDWEHSETYKACLHTHTTASDGKVPLKEWLELYYNAGYDILALTDHGVVYPGWNKMPRTNGIFNGFKKITPLTDEEYEAFQNGTYPFADGAPRTYGRGMIDIMGGVEINMAVVSKTHVNGYWSEYGQGVWGKENDYETAPKMVEKYGGYSVLNHVGDWVNSPNYPERSHNPFYINYFANIFTKYKTCLGMEIINNTDNCTRADRALWDELLQVVIPQGRNIWAFADDDSEYPSEVGRSFELFPMTECTQETVKDAMINGALFAASKYYRNSARDENEFEGDGLVPIVTDIRIDGNTITVQCDPTRGCDTIEWVADGKVIATDNSGSCTYTLDLNDYEDELGCYVRFVLKSPEHGVTYSQAFELRYDGRVDKPIPASPLGDGVFAKGFWLWYQRLNIAIVSLISEKILGAIGVLPKLG